MSPVRICSASVAWVWHQVASAASLLLASACAAVAFWDPTSAAVGAPDRAFVTYISHVGWEECYVDMAVALGENLAALAPDVARHALVVQGTVPPQALRRLSRLWRLLTTPDLNLQGDLPGHWGKAVSIIFMFMVQAKIAVYLDADTMVRNSAVLDLFDAPVSETGVGMTFDCCIRGNLLKDGTCCNSTRQVNAGVVVYRPSPAKFAKCWDMVSSRREQRHFFAAQDLYRTIFDGDILFLDGRFNFHNHDKNHVRRLRHAEKAVVVHFVGSPKPACEDSRALAEMRLGRYVPPQCGWCSQRVSFLYAEYFALLLRVHGISDSLKDRLHRAEALPGRFHDGAKAAIPAEPTPNVPGHGGSRSVIVAGTAGVVGSMPSGAGAFARPLVLLSSFPHLAVGAEARAAKRWCLVAARTTRTAVRNVSDEAGSEAMSAFLVAGLHVAAWLETNRGDQPSAVADATLRAEAELALEMGRFLRVQNGYTMRHCLASCDLQGDRAELDGVTPPRCTPAAMQWPVTVPRVAAVFQEAMLSALHELSRPFCVPSALRAAMECNDAVSRQSGLPEGLQLALGLSARAAALGLLALRWECRAHADAVAAIQRFFQLALRSAKGEGPQVAELKFAGRHQVLAPPTRSVRASAALERVRGACSPAARAAAPKHSRVGSVCIATAYLGATYHRRWMGRTLPNKRAFASRHGHALYVLTEPLGGANLFYDATDWPRRLLSKCGVVYRSDADAVFTKEAPSLEEVLAGADPAGTADLVVSWDTRRPPVDPQHHQTNLGNYFARDTPCAQAVLQSIGVLGEEGPDEYWCVGQLAYGEDQCAFATVIGESGLGEALGGAVRYVGHRAFNSMVPDGDFSCADPVLHSPGCRHEACADELLKVCPLSE